MIIKKIAAVVLTIAMAAASLAGCTKSFEKVVTVNGVDITPGMYLYAQYMAYLEAEAMVGMGTDVLSATIGETPAEDWIHTQTIEYLKKYIWVENTAKAMNVEITDADREYTDYQVSYYWPMAQEVLMANGISEDTYKKFVENEYVSEYIIFQELYGAGGQFEPTDSQIVEYMDNTYARIKGFELSKTKAGSDAFVDAQSLDDLKALAADAVARLNSGEDFETVMVEALNKNAEITGDETVHTTDEASKYVIERYLTRDDVEIYEELLTAKAFSLATDSEWTYNDTEKDIVVYQRIKNLKDQIEIDYYKLSLTYELCSEDYYSYIEEQTAYYEVVEDKAAVAHYSADKIK